MRRETTKISLLIPTKNEAEGIGWLLDEVRPFVDEVVVIDGHSTDNTVDVCRSRNVPVVLDNGKERGRRSEKGFVSSPVTSSS